MLRSVIIAGNDSSLQEAVALWESLGCQVAGTYIFNVRTPHPKYYVGPGQLASVTVEPDQVLYCDLPISPMHRREIEQTLSVTVWDREEVILRIFDQRAKTAEGKLQAKVAALLHQRRKLVGAWTHLDRQRGGGAGARGVGELQKELDQRILEDKIEALRRKLAKIKRQRSVRRRRESVALVGYTNAGKTSALRYLTHDSINPEDKLFATLDPRTRYWHLGNGHAVPLVDTVGFILNLPHVLIDAFHATLDEAVHASVVLHLHDISDPEYAQKGECVRATLKELGVDLTRVIDVWNKSDISNLQHDPSGFAVSCKTGAGWDKVREAVRQRLNLAERKVFVPRYDLIPSRCTSCVPHKNGFLVTGTFNHKEWMQLRHKIRRHHSANANLATAV